MRDTETLVSQLDPNPLVQKAYQFAATAHQGQGRKDKTEPFINHPLRVALIVQENQPTETDLICASLLHDTVEDTATKTEIIQREFSDHINQIVVDLTEDKSIDDWTLRMDEYYLQLTKCEPRTLLIKCADVIDNIESIIRYGVEHENKFPWQVFSSTREMMIARWTKLYQLFAEKLPQNDLLSRLEKDIQIVGNIY